MNDTHETKSASVTRMMSRAEIDTVNTLCAQMKDVPGALLPILHAVQKNLGFVPHDALPLIARELNLSIAEVHGVVTFYHYFRRDRGGRHAVHLCRAEACQARGAAALEAHAKRSLSIDFHGTTKDGVISLQPVYCLGNCALGPSILIDERLYGRVSTQRFDELMASTRRADGSAG
jgi:formate dehydrogenase subunit gamma